MISIRIARVGKDRDKERILIVSVYNLIPNARDIELNNLIIPALLEVLYILIIYYIRIAYGDYNLYYLAWGLENREPD